MHDLIERRRFVIALAATFGLATLPLAIDVAQAESSPDYLFHDAQFHLTNYVQQGTDFHKYLEIMGDKVGRSTLFGIPTDNVAPPDQATQLRVYNLWEPIWAQLTPEASLKIRKGNYERIFDAARLRVRAWEKANLK